MKESGAATASTDGTRPEVLVAISGKVQRSQGSGVALMRACGLGLTCLLLLSARLCGAVAQEPPDTAVRAQAVGQQHGSGLTGEDEGEETFTNSTTSDWMGSTSTMSTSLIPNNVAKYKSEAQPIASATLRVTGNSNGQLFGSVLHLSWCDYYHFPIPVLTGASRQGEASLLFTPEDWAANGGVFETSYATHPNEEGVCIVLYCAKYSAVDCDVTVDVPTFTSIETYVEAKSPICPSGLSPLFPMINMLTYSTQFDDGFFFECATPGVDGSPADPSPVMSTFLEESYSSRTSGDAAYQAWTCAESILCWASRSGPTPTPSSLPCPAGYERAPGSDFAYKGNCGDVSFAEKEALACSSGEDAVYSDTYSLSNGLWCMWTCPYGTFACMPDGSVWPIPRTTSAPIPTPTPTRVPTPTPTHTTTMRPSTTVVPTGSPGGGWPSSHQGSTGPNLAWFSSRPAFIVYGTVGPVLLLAAIAFYVYWRRREAKEAGQEAIGDTRGLQLQGQPLEPSDGSSGTSPLLSRGAPPAV